MQRRITTGGLGLILMAATGSAWSADGPTTRTGFYLGGSIGGVETQTRAVGLAPIEDPKVASGGRLRVGYWVTPHWGVEASYTGFQGIEQAFASGTFRARGEAVALSGLGRLPFADHWALVGKVSLNGVRIRDDGSTGSTAGFDRFRGRSGNLILPGLSLEYGLSDRLAVTLEADSLGTGGSKLGLDYGGIGLRWSF
jgi:hypothetical protein